MAPNPQCSQRTLTWPHGQLAGHSSYVIYLGSQPAPSLKHSISRHPFPVAIASSNHSPSSSP
eukprot:4349027-Prorocentrum_lima.AAC.1